MESVNLADAFGRIQELWKPTIVSAVNDTYVKLVKLKGEFVWHQHEAEDELFLVIEGSIQLQLRDGSVSLQAGEMAVVPKGVEHRPVAKEEARVLLIEPRSTRNTGNVQDDRTTEAEWIWGTLDPEGAKRATAKGLQREGGSPPGRSWQVLSRRNYGFSLACGCS